jgi:Acetyltransferase (GNAT) domain
VQELIDKIPAGLIFDQVFDPAFSDTFTFCISGFSVEVKHTFRIPRCTDTEAVWKGMRSFTRRLIRKAHERFNVETTPNIDRFVEFYMHQQRKEGLDGYPGSVRATTILTAAVKNAAGTAMFCVNKNDQPVAGIFLVWDQSYMYYLLSARDRQLSDNGAISLLVWKAIQAAGQRNLGFDFDGYSTIGTAKFSFQFGAQAVPRWKVRRMHPYVRALEAIIRRR